jgi:hypothetical protein
MPIRAEERDRYPEDWPAISGWVKWDRALGRCECQGQCGSRRHANWFCATPVDTPHRCPNYHGEPSRFTGALVVLTTAHLDHTPENNDPGNLLAMCQACHLAYDAEHHAQTRAGHG